MTFYVINIPINPIFWHYTWHCHLNIKTQNYTLTQNSLSTVCTLGDFLQSLLHRLEAVSDVLEVRPVLGTLVPTLCNTLLDEGFTRQLAYVRTERNVFCYWRHTMDNFCEYSKLLFMYVRNSLFYTLRYVVEKYVNETMFFQN